MSPTVTLERKTTGIVELRRSQFEIVLDGSPAGSIARNETALSRTPLADQLARRRDFRS